MVDLLKLAERVEALSGPDREVDELIERAVGTYSAFSHYTLGDDDQPDYIPTSYTASLDAAMMLCKPDESRWPQLEYISANPNNLKVGHRVWLWTKNGRLSRGNSMASAALAVCAAALRARAANG